jgi:hypothetical protein
MRKTHYPVVHILSKHCHSDLAFIDKIGKPCKKIENEDLSKTGICS